MWVHITVSIKSLTGQVSLSFFFLLLLTKADWFFNLNNREHPVVFRAAHFGQGTGPIIFDDLGCTGNETKLQNCRHAAFGHTDCSHSEDVGIRCGK